MRIAVTLCFFLSAAAPTARAAAVRPDAPKPQPPVAAKEKPEPVPKPPRVTQLPKKQKKNKAFATAVPQLDNPRWTVPPRLTRLIPEIEEESENDAYLDLFLNEEAEDLP